MSNPQHKTPTRIRLLLSLITTIALVLTSAFPAGFAYANEVVVEEDNPNEAVVVAQTPDQKNEVEVQANQTDATEQDVAVDEVTSQSLSAQASGDDQIDNIINAMSLDEKISQMIIPSIRTWDNENVQVLSKYPALEAALKAHQYGGISLFGQNISTVEQTGTLVNALQDNNMEATGRSKNIPYLMCVDGEGGVVVRFTMGTRMTGSMAVGATGANAQTNAFTTGKVLGEEIAALGIAADLAPAVDVNSNPSNPAIGTRSFSDDPTVVGPLGVEFSKGLAASKVIATYKHFPGNGDVATDSHLGLSISEKTEAELEACELMPFRDAIQSGADMIMTAHIMLPTYERENEVEEITFPDGNKGYYPATMSAQILDNLLRQKLGFNGVIITDALEMDALYEHQLVKSASPAPAGETKAQKMARLKADVAYRANLAEKCILSGVDILLMGTDLNNSTAVTFYDDYINAIVAKVGTGDGKTISEDRINQSVARILALKKKYGILNNYTPVDIDSAKAIVGSDEHHEAEMKIAREAITLVKNDDYALPLSGHENNVVILGRLKDDNMTIDYAIKELQGKGLIAQDARINNLVDPNRSSGSDSSKMHITIDYYYDSKNGAAHYTNALKDAIKNADTVICFTASYDAGPLAGTSPLYQCVSRALSATHAAGGKFVLLANNLPYDAARYQGADAAMLGYMSAGLGADPTDKSAGGVAYNANVVAAVSALFDDVNPGGPTGTLPVNIPDLVEKDNLAIEYTSDILYKRGFGLSYTYAFVEGAGGVHARYSGEGLAFKTNARYDKLRRMLVDDQELGQGDYAAAVGSTKIALAANYLDTLASGDHTLTAVYDYGGGEFNVSTTFSVRKDPAVSYASHVQRIGWQKAVTNGSMSGTTGKSRRVEALRISVSDLPCEGGISYRSHVQTKGWEKTWVSNGKTSGTTGKSKRVEAVQLKLTGNVAKQYDVYYRVHAQRVGWMAWAKNGASAGTQGMSRRIEAIQVVLVKKGQAAPAKDYQGVKQTYDKAFLKK